MPTGYLGADHPTPEELQNRPNLVPVLAALLTAHSRAEEAEVYPVARDEAGEIEDVAHSQEEHLEADQLLAELVATDPEQAAFDDVLGKLVKAVTHHVQEEGSAVLPALKERLSDGRRAELGDAFATARARHLGDRPGQPTRDGLELQARNADLPGRSQLTEDQLADELHPRS